MAYIIAACNGYLENDPANGGFRRWGHNIRDAKRFYRVDKAHTIASRVGGCVMTVREARQAVDAKRRLPLGH